MMKQAAREVTRLASARSLFSRAFFPKLRGGAIVQREQRIPGMSGLTQLAGRTWRLVSDRASVVHREGHWSAGLRAVVTRPCPPAGGERLAQAAPARRFEHCDDISHAPRSLESSSYNCCDEGPEPTERSRQEISTDAPRQHPARCEQRRQLQKPGAT